MTTPFPESPRIPPPDVATKGFVHVEMTDGTGERGAAPDGDGAVRTSLHYHDPAEHPRGGDVLGRLVLHHPDHPHWPQEGGFALTITNSVRIAEDADPCGTGRPMPPATLAQAREIVEEVRQRLLSEPLLGGVRVVLGVWLVGPHDRLITDLDLPPHEPEDGQRPRLVGMIYNAPILGRGDWPPDVDPHDGDQIARLLAEEVRRFDEHEHGEHHAWALVQCLGGTWRRVTPVSPAYATPELAQRAADAALAAYPGRVDQEPYVPTSVQPYQFGGS